MTETYDVPLLHAEELGDDGRTNGHTLCGVDFGLLANQPWQVTCEDCHRVLEGEQERGADESLSGDPDYGHDLDDHQEN